MNILKVFFLNTLRNFASNWICWILLLVFAVISLSMIIIVPALFFMPKVDDQNVLQTTWVGLLDEFSWIPMSGIFVVLCMNISNISDNTYILTSAVSRNKLFIAKILSQLFILTLFILFYVLNWLILWAIARQRTIALQSGEVMDPNIFSWGFTGWSIFVPQLLLALLAILLGSTFQFLVKNNINVLICIGLGAIGSIFYLTDVKPSPENIFMQSFAKPSIILSILILIGYPIGFLYIRNANIII